MIKCFLQQSRSSEFRSSGWIFVYIFLKSTQIMTPFKRNLLLRSSTFFPLSDLVCVQLILEKYPIYHIEGGSRGEAPDNWWLITDEFFAREPCYLLSIILWAELRTIKVSLGGTLTQYTHIDPLLKPSYLLIWHFS